MDLRKVAPDDTGVEINTQLLFVEHAIEALAAVRRAHSRDAFADFRDEIDDATNALAQARRSMERAYTEHAEVLQQLTNSATAGADAPEV